MYIVKLMKGADDMATKKAAKPAKKPAAKKPAPKTKAAAKPVAVKKAAVRAATKKPAAKTAKPVAGREEVTAAQGRFKSPTASESAPASDGLASV